MQQTRCNNILIIFSYFHTFLLTPWLLPKWMHCLHLTLRLCSLQDCRKGCRTYLYMPHGVYETSCEKKRKSKEQKINTLLKFNLRAFKFSRSVKVTHYFSHAVAQSELFLCLVYYWTTTPEYWILKNCNQLCHWTCSNFTGKPDW